MEVWSTLLNQLRCLPIQSASQGRNKCPAKKGTNNCKLMLTNVSKKEKPAPEASRSNRINTNSGVTSIPIRLEAEALHTAAARFPLASAVKAMADCTVPGKAQR